jgi:hypothetical protein
VLTFRTACMCVCKDEVKVGSWKLEAGSGMGRDQMG